MSVQLRMCGIMRGLSLEIVNFSRINKMNAINLIGLVSPNLTRLTTQFFSAQIQKICWRIAFTSRKKIAFIRKKSTLIIVIAWLEQNISKSTLWTTSAHLKKKASILYDIFAESHASKPCASFSHKRIEII